MFTGVSRVVPDYDSSWMMIYAQMRTAAEGCGRPPLCHCGVFDPVFLCAEFQGDLIIQMEDPTVVGKFATFSVKKYVCVFVLPFRSF